MPEQSEAKITNETLTKAVAAGSARVIFERDRFRLVIYGGMKYHCALVRFVMYAQPAGNTASDYRGTKSEWQIKKVEPDTGYQPSSKPPKAISADDLVPKLKQALIYAVNDRWSQQDFRLISPANIQVLIDEIERQQPAKAA